MFFGGGFRPQPELSVLQGRVFQDVFFDKKDKFGLGKRKVLFQDVHFDKQKINLV